MLRNTHYSDIESKMLMIGSDNNSSKWGGGGDKSKWINALSPSRLIIPVPCSITRYAFLCSSFYYCLITSKAMFTSLTNTCRPHDDVLMFPSMIFKHFVLPLV